MQRIETNLSPGLFTESVEISQDSSVLSLVLRFLDKTGVCIPKSRLYIQKNNSHIWVLSQNTVFLKNLTQFNGIFLDRIETGEVISAHGFFFVLWRATFRNRLDLTLDDARLEAYLIGMDLKEKRPDGWGAVTVAGCALGGYRSVGGTLKNLYPVQQRNRKLS